MLKAVDTKSPHRKLKTSGGERPFTLLHAGVCLDLSQTSSGHRTA